MQKLLTRVILSAATFVIGCAAVLGSMWLCLLPLPVLDEPALAQVKAPAAAIKALEVSVCDLKSDPAKYNHLLVKITGYFSRGFEDSTLYDPGCKSRQFIWVDMGGKRSINVMYCCGFSPKPTRDKELEVEGVKLPLTEDATFNQYDKSLAEGNNVKATVIGTFFSGKKEQYPGGTSYSGYGHMGIGSLFIVQQVLSSEVTEVKEN